MKWFAVLATGLVVIVATTGLLVEASTQQEVEIHEPDVTYCSEYPGYVTTDESGTVIDEGEAGPYTTDCEGLLP